MRQAWRVQSAVRYDRIAAHVEAAGFARLIARVPGAAWTALRSWFTHDAQRNGASIAFYAIFALAPLLLLVVVIAGLAFGDEAARGYVVGQLSGLVGQQSAEAIQALLAAARFNEDAGIVAVLSCIVTLSRC